MLCTTSRVVADREQSRENHVSEQIAVLWCYHHPRGDDGLTTTFNEKRPCLRGCLFSFLHVCSSGHVDARTLLSELLLIYVSGSNGTSTIHR